MSEPYLPLYVGDYLKDTGHLSTEQHGAYILLLMRMWSAGGTLPNDEVKLARLAGVSVKKWRPMWADLSEFFELEDRTISHKRVTFELQKAEGLREKRAAAGAKGGTANTLKSKGSAKANAKAEPEQIISGQEVSDASQAQHLTRTPSRGEIDRLESQCREAAGAERDISPGLFVMAPILGLIGSGHDLELDILPTIRAVSRRAKRRPSTWDYYTDAIREASAKRRGLIAGGLSPPVEGSGGNVFERLKRGLHDGPIRDGRGDGPTIDAVRSLPDQRGQEQRDDGESLPDGNRRLLAARSA